MGTKKLGNALKEQRKQVSIQLMSPASGDHLWDQGTTIETAVSIQLMSPASGDYINNWSLLMAQVSIQLMSPASGDVQPLQVSC